MRLKAFFEEWRSCGAGESEATQEREHARAAIAIMPGLWGAVPVLDIGDHDPSRYMCSDRSMKTWGRLSQNSAAEWSLYGSPGEHRGRGGQMSRAWPPESVPLGIFLWSRNSGGGYPRKAAPVAKVSQRVFNENRHFRVEAGSG
jgi:hypothetical protein